MTVNDATGKDPLKRPLKNCKLKFEGSSHVDMPQQKLDLSKGSFPATQLKDHSVRHFLDMTIFAQSFSSVLLILLFMAITIFSLVNCLSFNLMGLYI